MADEPAPLPQPEQLPVPAPDPVLPAHEPPVDEPAPPSAAARLRAFEDEHLGKDLPRINGQIERGVGSQFAKMPDHQRVHYVALEKLVAAEKGVADANAALAAAQAGHEAAINTAASAEKTAADSE